MTKRMPFRYGSRYCSAFRDAYGWNWDGRSDLADTELKQRLKWIMIKRKRSEIWAETPPKTRATIRLDVGDKADWRKLDVNMPDERHLFQALEATLELKLDAIIENVIEGLGAGEKCIVWVLTRPSVEIMADALEKATEARDVCTLMVAQNVRIWATHGEADIKSRNQTAAAFREHEGAGVIVATMDSMPEAISLLGATTEHYAQMHFLPGPMFQSENRAYAKDVSHLHIIYYVAIGTVDERIETLVIPRIETMEALAGEDDAAGTLAAFEKKKESFREMLDRLLKNMPEDGKMGGLPGGDDGDDD